MVPAQRLKGQRVYFDANVIIYQLIGYEPLQPQLAAVFGLVDRGECQAITSELTLAEIMVKPLRDGDAALQARCLAALESSGRFALEPVTRDVLIASAGIRATRTCKLPDAIHVACAQDAGCSVLLTNDHRLRGMPGLDIVVLAEIEPM